MLKENSSNECETVLEVQWPFHTSNSTVLYQIRPYSFRQKGLQGALWTFVEKLVETQVV